MARPKHEAKNRTERLTIRVTEALRVRATVVAEQFGLTLPEAVRQLLSGFATLKVARGDQFAIVRDDEIISRFVGL